MKRICLLLLAALELAALPALAASRPRYGGTLRVEARGSLRTMVADASDTYADRVALRNTLLRAVGDTLITLDARGEAQPALATAWRSENDGRRWTFTLRRNVQLHSGTTLTAQQVVTVLSGANPEWRVRLDGGEVLVEGESPLRAADFAAPANAIVFAGSGGVVIGTGPFAVATFEPEKRVVLRAFDDYWNGRPFLDSIELTMGRTLRDQAADLELARTDVIEVDAAQQRVPPSTTILEPPPTESFMLWFPDKPQSTDDARLREAVAASIDRTAINNVLLRRQGEASASLLPQWVSGYSFLFSAAPNAARARELRGAIGAPLPLSLSYDVADPLAKLVAERIAVNARDAGLFIQTTAEPYAIRTANADMRLLRVHLDLPDAQHSLAAELAPFGLSTTAVRAADSLEEQFRAESDALATFRVVPIAHLSQVFGSAGAVHRLNVLPDSTLDLADTWIEVAKP